MVVLFLDEHNSREVIDSCDGVEVGSTL